MFQLQQIIGYVEIKETDETSKRVFEFRINLFLFELSTAMDSEIASLSSHRVKPKTKNWYLPLFRKARSIIEKE